MRRIARQGWRQLVLLMALLLVIAYLAKSLLVMQVLQLGDPTMAAYYQDEVAVRQVQPPTRGIIVDATGSPLVGTVHVFKLIAWPPYVTDRAKTARAITDLILPLRLPSGKLAHNKKAIARARAAYARHYQGILGRLGSSLGYVCLAGEVESCTARHNITEGVASRIRALSLPGIGLEALSKPSYPNGGLAAHLLGYVTYGNKTGDAQYDAEKSYVGTGQYGLERYYDALLSGTPGHTSVRQDTSGNAIRVGAGADSAPRQGGILTLTLDSYLQWYVEQQLAQMVRDTHALTATIIVERPSDGAILAMASIPSYDPGNWRQAYLKYRNSRFIDPAISDLYEPGSTFKPIIAATGIDTGSFTQYTPVYDPGKLQVDGITIQNWCTDSCFFGGQETVRDMLKYSSNIAATQFSRIIPDIPFYQYLDGFGLGQPTGVDLAGEASGDVRKPGDAPPKLVWVRAYKDTTAYGQGIAVTPLQLANAYAVLANGGLLVRPHLVQSYTLDGKTTIIPTAPIRRVISQSTSDQMRQIMTDSAVGGEACEALVPGYNVAAKTGTSTIALNSNATIASTAAFAPSENPQFVVLVVGHMPDQQFGSEVASPVVRRILQELFAHYHIAPSDYPTQPKKICAAPFRQ